MAPPKRVPADKLTKNNKYFLSLSFVKKRPKTPIKEIKEIISKLKKIKRYVFSIFLF
jgi:hypothetical protein